MCLGKQVLCNTQYKRPMYSFDFKRRHNAYIPRLHVSGIDLENCTLVHVIMKKK